MLNINSTNGSDNHSPWQSKKHVDPFRHPVMCPHCKKDTGLTREGLMFYCATSDLCCPHCGEVVVPSNNVIC